jgi:hypothetical protein
MASRVVLQLSNVYFTAGEFFSCIRQRFFCSISGARRASLCFYCHLERKKLNESKNEREKVRDLLKLGFFCV